jgi:hypothetical protein
VRLDAGALDLDEALAGGAALGRALKSIKEQLRTIPEKGLHYGLLRHLNDETGAELAALPEPQRARRLLGLPSLLAGLPRAELNPEEEARFRHGQALGSFPAEGLCAVFSADGAVIGLGAANGALRPLRLLAQAADKR